MQRNALALRDETRESDKTRLLMADKMQTAHRKTVDWKRSGFSF
jgi:hypothetical protein